MNNLSDYQAHQRDAAVEAMSDAQWRKAKKCPIHHIPLVVGIGVGGKLNHFPEGKCPECFWAERRES